MSITKVGIELIKHYESLHDGDLSKIGLQPKMDCSGYWTEGWGHLMLFNGKPIKGEENKELAYKIAKISDPNIDDDEEAEILLLEDIFKTIKIIKKKLKVNLLPYETDALISHTFNTGGSDTLFQLLNAKIRDNEKIKEWWCNHYVTSDGIRKKGLVFRRKDEYNLFLTGILKFSNV